MILRLSLRTILLLIAFQCVLPINAQDTTSVDRCCLITTSAFTAAGIAGGLVLLDRAWYSGFEREPFHYFDDSGEWLQMDKAGHFFSAYTLGSWGHAMLDRCHASDRTSVWLGGSFGLLFLSGIEVLDGTSAGWGFSWSDMAANLAGTGFFIGQQLLWDQQRIAVKFSAHTTRFAQQRPDLLGEGLVERILKDYNGQTIWLSANIDRFAPSELPQWLNLAFGYSATGMITAHPPEPRLDYFAFERTRQYFISPDIDLTRIETRSKVLRTAFFILNAVKIPAPAIEFRSNGKVIGHLIYF